MHGGDHCAKNTIALWFNVVQRMFYVIGGGK